MIVENQFQEAVEHLVLDNDSPIREATGLLKDGATLSFLGPAASLLVRKESEGFTIGDPGDETAHFDFTFIEEEALYRLRDTSSEGSFGNVLKSLLSEGKIKVGVLGELADALDVGIGYFMLNLGIVDLPPGYPESLRSSALKDVAFTEILDIDYLQELIDSLAKVIGVRLWIMDMNCIPVAVSDSGGEHCKLIVNSLTGALRCYASAIDSMARLKEALVPQVRKCHAGFICFDVPLMLNGEMVGMVTGDASLSESASPEAYASLAGELDVNADELISSLSDISCLSMDEINLILSVVSAVAKVVMETSTKQFMLAEKIKELTGLHEVSSLVTRPLNDDLEDTYRKIADEVGSLKKGSYCRLSLDRNGRKRVFEAGQADCPEQIKRIRFRKDIKVGKKKMGSIELMIPRMIDAEDTPLDDHFFESLASQIALATQNSNLYRELREKNEELRALLHAITQIQENERASLARDLHDDTGQNLNNALLHLEMVLKDDGIADRNREHLDRAADALSTVIEQLQDMSVRLHPSLLDDLGLVEALTDLLRRLDSEHPVHFSLEICGGERPLSSETKISIYRIIQEALSNIVQHSGAKRATIYLGYELDGVDIIVADDGEGLKDHKGKRKLHLGLASMRERCEQMGGKFSFIPSPDGTLVTVQLPQTVFEDARLGS